MSDLEIAYIGMIRNIMITINLPAQDTLSRIIETMMTEITMTRALLEALLIGREFPLTFWAHVRQEAQQ
jgi:hypothetical protein